ncbi:MAG: DUF642 domain-containing protein [Akkermansiaceae bacterium]|jgi:hypothetical protein|nr:DUF642 domain-containing protein [Akkermansiaceae bacterium]
MKNIRPILKSQSARRAIMVPLSVLGTACMSHAATNIIVNGSFEDPSITGTFEAFFPLSTTLTGWNIPGPFVTIVHHAPDAGIANNSTYNFAQSGSNYLDLSATGAQSMIYQDFATIPSTTYNLSFYIGASNSVPPAATIRFDLTGSAALLGESLTPTSPSTNINWTLKSYSFVADSTTTRLSLNGLSGFDDNASFIDSISVTAVPEPSGALLLGLGSSLLFVRRRRMPR